MVGRIGAFLALGVLVFSIAATPVSADPVSDVMHIVGCVLGWEDPCFMVCVGLPDPGLVIVDPDVLETVADNLLDEIDATDGEVCHGA